MDRPVTTLDAARALVASPRWPAVRTFLWDFLPLVHPARLAPLAPRCPGFDLATPATLPPRVKTALLAELRVEPAWHDFPATDHSRLLLLPPATLDSIARWLGALSCADALRRVTSGPAVRALKTALPGIYPDLFAFAPYFARHPLAPAAGTADAADPAPAAIPARGRALLLAHLSALPPPLLHRFRLLFPPDAEPAPDPALPGPPPPEAVLLLLKLKFPEAHALCSS